MTKLTICMYGAASNNIDSIYITETEKLGEEIAQRHHRLIYGGGATGLMGACARGAARYEGTIIGVVPGFMNELEPINANCTEIIHTETMSERKQIMEDNADAFIIVPGGIGTLDEFFQILTLTELKRKFAPIVLFNINGFYDDLISFLNFGIGKGFIRENVREICHVCDTAPEALNYIEHEFSS
ncbi:MAG: TIGR00730 family Rossman fold protein [Lachnospiraceae bacterium]|nr:TIGR00730 family Rossman fold protein [Lachnospiraceae bacterium]